MHTEIELVATPTFGYRFSGWWAWALLPFSLLLFVAIAFVHPVLTLISTAVIVGFVSLEVRIARNRWQLDRPGHEQRFRFGASASRGVRVADIGGIVVRPAGGMKVRLIQVTKHHELWFLVDRDNRCIGIADAEGIEQQQVERFRAAIGVPFANWSSLQESDSLPTGLPRNVRQPWRMLLPVLVVGGIVLAIAALLPPYWG